MPLKTYKGIFCVVTMANDKKTKLQSVLDKAVTPMDIMENIDWDNAPIVKTMRSIQKHAVAKSAQPFKTNYYLSKLSQSAPPLWINIVCAVAILAAVLLAII